ncbi:PrgI family mobile element protein [Nocardiopsis changdeensis]|uniref:PrgI family protein n=1 Tax=Nocardiopsis changdeensis TaxID=2831969 RepID=A0ABX8BEE6_9ACTN|nr:MULTISPECIES: PrgI family protein [Nocardiopsis]QUX20626.1 PrgI family protein [Nocardiopsis changdeensis]QYX36557.1 PrgI family protein [Nocardiopsis sp. MT53]
MDREPSTWQAQIPTDIDVPEPILWGLTARQLLIMAPAVLLGWALFTTVSALTSPISAVLAAAVPIGCAWVLSRTRRDGIGLDHRLWLAARWHTSPRTRDPDAELPPIAADGVIDHRHRCAVVLECTTVPFHLASGQDQDRMLAAWAALLDSLTEPIQILIQRRRTDLDPHLRLLRSHLDRLPEALCRSARAHAVFLASLQHHHDLIHHRVLLVLTHRGPEEQNGDALLLRAHDIAAQLAALGVRVRVHDGPGVQLLLTSFPAPATAESGSEPATTEAATTEER